VNQRHATQFDLVVVIVGTALCALVSIRFDLSERILAITHAEEWAQLDEVPQILLVLALFLAWFAWRRLQEARREIARRIQAETRLADALLEIRQLGHRHTQIQEDERRGLAREIHDELGQYLVALKLEAAMHAADEAANAADELLALRQGVVRHVDHMHASVRALIARLRPAGLDELGVATAIENLVRGWQARLEPISIRVDVGDLPEHLPEDLSLALYRLAQECLTNLSRHARATAFGLRIQAGADAQGRARIELLAQDNGVGCEQAALRQGYGLAGMRERVEALGGTLHIETRPGHGFAVHAVCPVRPS
jgi:signal transduction histidine kinase